MPKRPRFSRSRRLPPVFRLGEHRLAHPDTEPQRLTLYISGESLDLAQAQAARTGGTDLQEYCAGLLLQALDIERVREQVADLEAKRGPLEGLNEIANDPDYLAEWSEQLRSRQAVRPMVSLPSTGAGSGGAGLAALDDATGPALSAAARIVLRHAGQGEGGNEPAAFLPSLRRGEAVALAEVAELARALQTLDAETRGATSLDRRVVFALYRLAYEAQILHTDAWPRVFDSWTVDMIRAVQEAVDRLLSGRDLHDLPSAPTLETDG